MFLWVTSQDTQSSRTNAIPSKRCSYTSGKPSLPTSLRSRYLMLRTGKLFRLSWFSPWIFLSTMLTRSMPPCLTMRVLPLLKVSPQPSFLIEDLESAAPHVDLKVPFVQCVLGSRGLSSRIFYLEFREKNGHHFFEF